MKNVDAEADESDRGKRSGKRVGARATVAFLIKECKAVFVVLDENHIGKILVADLRDFAAPVDLFVLNVLSGQELFEVFKLPIRACAGVLDNVVCRTRHVRRYPGHRSVYTRRSPRRYGSGREGRKERGVHG